MLCVVHAATLLITPRAGSVLTAAARGMRRAAALGDGEASAAAAHRTFIAGLHAARHVVVRAAWMAGELQPPGLYPWLRLGGDACHRCSSLSVDHEPVLGLQLPSLDELRERAPQFASCFHHDSCSKCFSDNFCPIIPSQCFNLREELSVQQRCYAEPHSSHWQERVAWSDLTD